MPHVATLIGSENQPLREEVVEHACSLINECGGTIAGQSWLAEGEAADITFTGAKDSLSDAMQEWVKEATLDVVIQPAEGRRKKALLADMESTLIKEEMLEELADFVGLRARVEEITTRAMNGELDFKAALKERLALLKNVPSSILDDLCKKATMMGGATELVATMRGHGAHCVIVSGGFKVFTDYVARQLGFHENYGNALDIVDGNITGEMLEPVLDKHSKRAQLGITAKQLAIFEQDIIAVGDGANDVPMLLAAGLGIAFHAKPSVQLQAQHNIRFANLRGLLWAQGYKARDIVVTT